MAKSSKWLSVRNLRVKYLSLFFILFLSGLSLNAQKDEALYSKGESVFQGNCASCHGLEKGQVVAAPSLYEVNKRWEKQSEGLIYEWVKNPTKIIDSGDPYVSALYKKWTVEKKYAVMPGQAVSNDEIDAVLHYVQYYEPPIAIGDESFEADEENNSSAWPWLVVIILLFAVIILSVGGIKRLLISLARDEEDKEQDEIEEDQTYLERIKEWAWENKKLVSLIFLSLIVIGAYDTWVRLIRIDVDSPSVEHFYQPPQKIAFSHIIHAKQNGINCQYCHSTAEKSKHANIPSLNICMNCHNHVQKGPSGTKEIQKIYDALGYNPTTKEYDKSKEKPFQWVRVHALPDHVYFPHKQHVKVAGLQCENCHGDVKNYTVGKVAPVAEINALEEELSEKGRFIPFDEDNHTLTMGWCIDCHGKAEIDLNSSDYYKEMHDRMTKDQLKAYLEDDGLISVKEMGGWNCSKCHY